MSRIIEINSLESTRFGIRAARLSDARASLDAVNKAAREQQVDMITTRIDVGDLETVHALEADGYRLMDALVYYTRDLPGHCDPITLPEGIQLRPAKPQDSSEVARIAGDAFAGYIGHYHADPMLENSAADAAYVEWAETSVRQVNKDNPVILAQRGDNIVGFATIRKNDDTESEGVLFGIHPAAQRGGLYGSLMKEALQQGIKIGSSRFIVSTQINNYAVQKVWARQGFAHCKSLYTFHKWFT